MIAFDPADAFATFPFQDSGCASYGIDVGGRRLFVKMATTPAAAASLRRAIAFHSAVAHPTIVAPIEVLDDGSDRVQHPEGVGPDGGGSAGGPVLVYPWHDGEVLHAAAADGPDRRALHRFQQRPVGEVEAAIGRILDAHLAVVEAGFVAVDLYDGCFLYDFDRRAMRLIDLDEYRPGPFVVAGERLPGSRKYMAPEELTTGATIDERTTVFNLGRAILHLLSDQGGTWRGTVEQLDLVAAATSPAPSDRIPTVADLVAAWRQALTPRRSAAP